MKRFRHYSRKKQIGFIVALMVLFIFVSLVLVGFKPFSMNSTVSPSPATSYEEAISGIEAIRTEEAELVDLHPMCGTQVSTHEKKTENVIVFLHGFTSCPDQFTELGNQYFDLGYNVFIPREPHHGLSDRLGTPLKNYTAEEMITFANNIADIAQGLGDRVIIVGLSGGGAMATWLAQERTDVDLAVPIAPFLGIGFIPEFLNRPLTNLILLIPDFFQWWDPVNKENNPNSAPYSYTRYPIHSLFENLRLGYVVEADSRRVKPAAGQILVITNDNDESVNNDVIAGLEKLWLQHGEESLKSFRFDQDLGLPHDLITTTRPGAMIDLVYPKLMELIH